MVLKLTLEILEVDDDVVGLGDDRDGRVVRGGVAAGIRDAQGDVVRPCSRELVGRGIRAVPSRGQFDFGSQAAVVCGRIKRGIVRLQGHRRGATEWNGPVVGHSGWSCVVCDRDGLRNHGTGITRGIFDPEVEGLGADVVAVCSKRGCKSTATQFRYLISEAARSGTIVRSCDVGRMLRWWLFPQRKGFLSIQKSPIQ